MTMGDLKTRLRAKFTRRHSSASTTAASQHDAADSASSRKARSIHSRASHKASSLRKAAQTTNARDRRGDDEIREEEGEVAGAEELELELEQRKERAGLDEQGTGSDGALHHPTLLPAPHQFPFTSTANDHEKASTVGLPTPSTDHLPTAHEEEEEEEREAEATLVGEDNSTSTSSLRRPTETPRRQSLLPSQQTRLIKTLLDTALSPPPGSTAIDYFTHHGPSTISGNMVSRKIWVKRPGASATLVQIHEEDLVDDVREMILKKYTNSLGRSFDAPDVTLRIVSREHTQERVLGPEEPMGRTLDAHYPGGQTVEEALIIDVPHKKTPKPSPQPHRNYYDEHRPTETGTDYFPPMPVPVPAIPSPHLPSSVPVGVNGQASNHHMHAMSVLTTGHVPALPSPGSTRRYHRERPRVGRQHTVSSAVSNSGVSQTPTIAEQAVAPPSAPPLPSPPATIQPLSVDGIQLQRASTPPPRVSSPRPSNNRLKKKKAAGDHPSLPTGMLNGAVPPINVLIVEDNIINLKLLEAFMKRLKVRWQTAMNGKAAVDKWRAGGFHLVLMDIQLPIMSGLEATKEIRRLERLNSIGVFSSSASTAPDIEKSSEPQGEDKLPDKGFFKSPVIIVALTASSLQSDRHEALAAGCNDFLTKPVNFVWLERKVMEWGCMQALIDFDGWRKWKDFSQQNAEKEKEKQAVAAANKKKKSNRMSLGSNAAASGSRSALVEAT